VALIPEGFLSKEVEEETEGEQANPGLQGKWSLNQVFCLKIVSQKNVPHLTCYDLDIHGSITIFFGKCYPESRQSKCTLFSHLT